MKTTDSFIVLRRELHQYPEVSLKEFDTSERIQHFFSTEILPDETILLEGAGVAFVIQGKRPGKTILFRCELDALPIQEKNTFDYASKNEGNAHLCGHDGHMATLCALAKKFRQGVPEKGKVVFLFQPAEENGFGAKMVLQSPDFRKILPDLVIAWHNVPGFTLGELLIRKNNFTPNVVSCKINLIGKTAHAGEPQNGLNPVFILSDLIRFFEPFTRELSNDEIRVAIPYAKVGGESYGVSAGEAVLGVTFRSNETGKFFAFRKRIEEEVIRLCADQLTYSINYFEEFLANINDGELCDRIVSSAEKADFPFQLLDAPFSWGEDFGVFTQEFQGCLLGVGAGVGHPALHNPDYDFPDKLIEPVSGFLYQAYIDLQND